MRELFEWLAGVFGGNHPHQLFSTLTQLPQEIIDPGDLTALVGQRLCGVPQRGQRFRSKLTDHADQPMRLFALPLRLGQHDLHRGEWITHTRFFRFLVRRLHGGDDLLRQTGQLEVAVFGRFGLQLFVQLGHVFDPVLQRIHARRQRPPALIERIQRFRGAFVAPLVLVEQSLVGHLEGLVPGDIPQQLLGVGLLVVRQYRDALFGREPQRLFVEQFHPVLKGSHLEQIAQSAQDRPGLDQFLGPPQHRIHGP